MSLSNDIISQFVKITNDTQKVTKKETITYGKVSEIKNDQVFVVLDGTAEDGTSVPVSTTVNVKAGDRVIIMIKNHSAVITGNLGDPATTGEYVDASTGEIKTIANEAKSTAEAASTKVSELDILVVKQQLDTEALTAKVADIETLEADSLIVQTVKANKSDVASLTAKDAEITGKLEAVEANIDELQTNKLDATEANLTYAKIETLDVTNLKVDEMYAHNAEFDELKSAFVDIENLKTDKLSVEDAKIAYANIDFSNIGEAAIEKIFVDYGIIENVVIGDGVAVRNLVGVTIKGDLIEGGTVVADKLVIQGEDGLYYKLNTDGVTTGAEQTEYNSLNGSVITAKSITATQISVDDLVAFDATIGGFNITEDSIYSEVKDDEGNTTRGIYMDTDGQINFGDASNFIKYYRDTDGSYKLAISAASILYALNGKQYSIADLGALGEYVHIGTYEGEPCIELGESDSDFRLIITNTRIMFTEGSAMPAYINNQSLHITKAVIEEEIQQGEFVWKVRANGNMGLMWKGGS